MRKEQRIEFTDSSLDIIVKLAEGNPGAAMALADMYKIGGKVDPTSAWQGLGPLINLEAYGIYGTDIYVLWSDICRKDTVKVIAVLRACQLGLFSSDILKEAAARQDGTGIELVPVEDLYSQVKERLEDFDKG